MTAAAAAETRTSHRATRVRVAPAPAPRCLLRQVRDRIGLLDVERNPSESSDLRIDGGQIDSLEVVESLSLMANDAPDIRQPDAGQLDAGQPDAG